MFLKNFFERIKKPKDDVYDYRLIKKSNEIIVIKIKDKCLGLQFIAVYDPFNKLSSSHLDKIEQYMYNFSTFLSAINDDIIIVYTKINERYDKIIKKIESKMNRIRILLELGDNDVKKQRELKILEQIHENLLNSRNVYRLLLLFVVRVLDECDSVEATVKKRTRDLINLIESYLDLKPYLIRTSEVFKGLNIIPLPDARILIDRKKTILIVGDSGAALLPFDRKYNDMMELDLSGIYIGYDIVTNKPILLSPDKHLKFHGIIVGPTGKGKTTLLASMFIRTDMLNYKVIAIDFKGDMSRYLDNSAPIIYGFNLETLVREYEKSNSNITKWIFHISRIWANTLGLRKSEAYTLLKALQQVIMRREDLSSLMNYIDNDKFSRLRFNDSSYDRLLESIIILNSRNNSGSVFNNSYVLNLERYPDYIKELLSSLILSFEMFSASPLSRFNKLILVDEAWRLRETKPNILSTLYREGRSLGIGVFSSSQLLCDLPKAVVENTHTFIVFGSRSKDYMNEIKKLFRLTSKELEKLSNLKTGEAALILKDSKRPIWVKVVSEIKFDEK